MKKHKLLNSYSQTEKVLISLAVVLMTTLLVKTATTDGTWIDIAFADESSGGSEEKSSSGDSDEKSSSDSSDETSSNDSSEEKSSSDPNDEMSYSDDSYEKSSDNMYEKSQSYLEDSVDDMSVDEMDEVSVSDMDYDEVDEMSVEKSYGIFTGGAPYEGMFDEDNFDEVMEFETGEKIVKKQEKLFFLIPVDIESTVTVDSEGMITAVRQTLLQRILSWISF